jgi:hypothetical protein
MELIIFISILLILSLIYILVNNYYKNIESYSNSKDNCNIYYDKNSFCQLNVDKNICSCKFQKDDNKYSFNSPEPCCTKICNDTPLEECLNNDNFSKISYYCNIGGKCKEYKGTIINSHISANNCGNDPLTNQLLLPYESYEECSKSLDICDKYNIPNRSKHINKNECLKDVNCGYCSNEYGDGKCISGNATGPSDLMKYYYCSPNETTDKDSYVYGNHVAYLLQK